MTRRRAVPPPWLALLAMVLLASACKREEPVFNTRIPGFDTQVDLTIIGVDRNTAARAAAALKQDFAFMRASWHAWKPGTLNDVNHALVGGEWFSVPPSLLPLIALGRRYSQLSGGLIDPAMGKLMGLWGFHSDSRDSHPPPSAAAIAALVRAAPKMSDLERRGLRMRSHNPQLQLDFGSFVTGYGIDQAIAHLRELGVHNAILSVDGNLRAIGDRDGQPWRVALRRPGGGVYAIIEVSGDESVFTAGDYKSDFTYQGKTYHHILDPRTGYPARGAHAVTVLGTDAATADATSNALMIAGPKAWVVVARRMGIHDVLLLDDSGALHMTPAMAKRVRFLGNEPDIRLSEPL